MLVVRFATPNDVLEMKKLLIEAWKITYDKLYSKAYIQRVIEEFYNEERLHKEVLTKNQSFNGYMVAEKDGLILGCICGGCESDTGFIYALYVHPEFKQKGIGKELLRVYTAYQKEHYAIKKQAVSVVENNQMGIPFYEKVGFVLSKTVPNWFDNTQGYKCHFERSV
ncbi:GNAT family N-acetyltransferase [Streptococcus marimammalium]|uniref:GNAT family N-acetyltransferase n=1 Tax=Streptococcus marimammalium TaxID=269666 RepID=UPI00039E40B0|nr:N-acetyltransferase [Streptococcus marimammalium]